MSTATHTATHTEFAGLPAADADWLGAAIEEVAGFTEPGTGVTRLAYTPLEREAHAWFAEHMTKVGCTVHTDAAGNTIATRPGRTDGPAIGTGSHLDSVYGAGRFDGIAGSVAAMEVARMLDAGGVETNRPLRFVVFAGEEGARFGQACLGSKLAAGLASTAELDRVDRDGVTLGAAMAAVGFDGHAAVANPWRPADWAAFIELHVEQGSVLETAGLPVGVVDLISGSTRVELTLNGRPSHTGGTPMPGRADALAAAAECVLLAEQEVLAPTARGARATVGRLTVSPNSITTIPGQVTLSLDVRDVDADRQRLLTAAIVAKAHAAGLRRGVEMSARILGDTSPVVLPLWLRETITGTATDTGVPYRVLTSGASHDSQMVNRVTPAAMIFVPSRDGLSHVPEEFTSPADIATGVDLLARSILRLDARLGPARENDRTLTDERK